ncbi:MAG TPA: bifunctional oligoribonuclease/PAP phosphatase NrnA [Abditibacteriaceae bacterium]|jgi:phosphoesterase RecJ-like protein
MTTAHFAASAPPFDEILAAIEKYHTFLIVAHVGPDGDAIGSGLALQHALRAMGKDAWMISNDAVPPSCRFLPDWDKISGNPPTQPPCVFILDCDGTPPRVAAPYHLIENTRHKVLIDHHRTSQPIFDVNWIDPSQSATALMLYQLIKKLPVELNADIAQCLLCGLSTDTGNFRFPNTTPACLHAAADLVELGADPAEVAFKLFDERSFGATKLLGIALQKMECEADGQLTWAALTAQDFDTAQAGDEGSENVVNFLRSVRGARMAIILRERFDETGTVTRVSVRCDPEMRADLFCQKFGGGGHAAAAGFRVRHKSFIDSVAYVVQSAAAWLREDHPPVENAVN